MEQIENKEQDDRFEVNYINNYINCEYQLKRKDCQTISFKKVYDAYKK